MTDSLSCPAPDARDAQRITLAHGEGGQLMRRLIRERILTTVGNDLLLQLGDATPLPEPTGQHVVTTDSFVVSPMFFPGGDIGSLSVFGTVNDLAVAGAKPLWTTLAMIIEEGLPIATLDKVLRSVASAARRSNVQVVAGDTKVVPHGAADGLFINTTGIGELIAPHSPGPNHLEVGDEIIVSGPIGQHGMAVMTAREGFDFDPSPTSDSAPLTEAVDALREANISIRAMRDATRGGLGAVLHEWAEASRLSMSIDETQLPVAPEVRGACELLGIDPIHVACEGTMLVAVEQDHVVRAVQVLRKISETASATRIGNVRSRSIAPVIVCRVTGQQMPLDEPLGAALPRIC